MAGRRNNKNWRERVFLDTSALMAVYNDKDEKWEVASKVLVDLANLNVDLVLTDYVLGEAYTGILGEVGYQGAMKFDENLRKEIWQVEWMTPQRFAAAQEVFRKFNRDKKWSFVDCASFVVMKELKLKKVFTYDKDFEQMGFEVL